jgi:glycosyltransferase involved in cell wall biosynthesis
MKILFLRESEIKNLNPEVIETKGFGATETCFICLAEELSKTNDVKVICPCLVRKMYGNVEYIPLSSYTPVKRLLDSFKPDAFVVVGNPSVLFHHVTKNVRAIFWQHNHPQEMNNFPIRDLLKREIPIVFPSKESQEYAKKIYCSEKIYGINNGVRDEFYKDNKVERIKNKVVYIGALVKSKGVLELLKVSKKLYDFSFNICGSFDMHTGSIDNEFFRICKENSGENVSFLGSLNKHDVFEQLVTSELCVVNPLVSNKEVFCVCALEAMATGTPVLAGGNSLIDSIISHGGISYTKKLDECIIDIMSDVEKKKQLGHCGKEFAKNFRWSLIALEWQRFLETQNV